MISFIIKQHDDRNNISFRQFCEQTFKNESVLIIIY
ncbi:GTP pyrophosphokinase [Bacillus pseudomycoides]|nr:GTP pyrophosphokinase [Bacillus pseudomycoides]